MPEWWTYGLTDFLMFSPRAYYRLIERYNVAVWPGQILTVSGGTLVLGLLQRPGAWLSRIMWAMLAALWCWVGLAFLWARYATINWAISYIVPLFVIEGILLLWIGLARDRLRLRTTGGIPGMIGGGLFAFAVALYPAIAPLLGRDWKQAEVFGLAPDPTAIATLGLLLLTGRRVGWTLLAVPVLWCLISGLTLWVMGSSAALVPPLAALLALSAHTLAHPSPGVRRVEQ